MRIGIIGSGNIGGTLGLLWTRAGHAVLFSSRHPERLTELAERAGRRARAGTVAEAAAFGDVVLFSPNFWGTDDALAAAGSLAGKVVIDTTNPYRRDFSGIALPATTTAAQELARKLPQARVVKAFNTPRAAVLAEQHHQQPDRVAVYYSGNDPAALETVARLIADAGFAPVHAGPLDRVARQEPRGPLYNKVLDAGEARRLLAQHP